MKKTIVAIALSGILSAAFAQSPVQAKKAMPMTCAVETHSKIDIAKATKNHMYADYKGNRYFFCCAGCPAEFKKNPEKYKSSAHIKTPKATK